MTHQEKVGRWLHPLEAASGIGVEIGPFKTPVPGINPIYVDRFKEYAGEPCLADYYGDAANLPPDFARENRTGAARFWPPRRHRTSVPQQLDFAFW